MKYLYQLSIILSFSVIGEILHYFIPLPIPAGIYGVILLFAAMKTGVVNYRHVKDTGHFLLNTMLIMFVPAGVGITQVWDVIRPSLIQYVLTAALSTVIVMAVSGRVAQLVIDRSESAEKEGQKE